MKRLLSIGIIFLFIGMSISSSTGFNDMEQSNILNTNGKTLYVGGSGPGNYTKIQDAIDNASDGDTVFVYNGTYYENVEINKTIDLIGEDRSTTIIDGNGSGDVVYIYAEYVNISGFTIRYGGKNGIFLDGVKNSTINSNIMFRNRRWGINLDNSLCNNIMENDILDNYYGILLMGSNNNIEGNTIYSGYYGIKVCCSNNTIIGNNIPKNYYGIQVYWTSNNIISNNNILNSEYDGIEINPHSNSNIIMDNNISMNNFHGIFLNWGSKYNTITGNNIFSNKGDGIYMCFASSKNTITNNNLHSNNKRGIRLHESNKINITGNKISNNSKGIYLYNSIKNRISDNIISNNDYGIKFSESSNNIIYHNNVINNTQNAYDECNNTWDNDYPSGGNYWDDYIGNDPDGDGIGDTPYNISGGDNQDKFPLMEPYIKDDETELDIGFISGGLFKIKAEIKNIGKYNATRVYWTIHILGKYVPIMNYWYGTIDNIKPNSSEIITTGLILGFGKYNISVTAEASNAPKVSKSIDGYIILFFIIIR